MCAIRGVCRVCSIGNFFDDEGEFIGQCPHCHGTGTVELDHVEEMREGFNELQTELYLEDRSNGAADAVWEGQDAGG